MHMIIRAVVYAASYKEALEKGKVIFKRLTEEGAPFDYFVTFDEEGSVVSGKGRWGNLPAVSLVTSRMGQKLIRNGMKWTKESFIRSLQTLRKVLGEKTDEEIFEDELDDAMFRYRCYNAGQYEGSEIYLYDNDGSGIRTPKHLEDTLNKWQCLYEEQGKKSPYKDLGVYVVPADVHF